MINKKAWRIIGINSLIVISMILLSVLFVYPMMRTNTIYFGDDMFYHIQRIRELVTNAKSGTFFTGIYTATFGKIGYPLNLFYPWVTLMPFVFFSIVVKDNLLGIYIGISFYTFLTLMFTYWTTHKFSHNRVQAFVTAVLYGFCAYRTIDIFSRFALGEFIALTFLPLAIYGIYSIFEGDPNEWPFLALGISFVLLSHILSTIIDCLALLLVLVLCAVHGINHLKSRLIAFIKAILVAISSSAIFLFPFLSQEIYQKFDQPTKMDLSLNALSPSKLISASLNNTFGRIDAGNTYNIGFFLILILMIGLFLIKHDKGIYKSVYILGALFFIAASSLMPWSIIQRTPVSLIQFPWRFLGISSYFLSLYGGHVFDGILSNKDQSMKQAVITFLVVILILCPWVSGLVNQMHQINSPQTSNLYQMITYGKNDRFHLEHFNFNNLNSLYHLSEYTPSAGEKVLSNIVNHEAESEGKKFEVNVSKHSPNSITFRSSKFKTYRSVILPIFNYQNTCAYDKSGHSIDLVRTNDARSKVKLNRNSNEINIRYRVSILDKVSILISLFSWCCLLVGGLIHSFKRISLNINN